MTDQTPSDELLPRAPEAREPEAQRVEAAVAGHAGHAAEPEQPAGPEAGVEVAEAEPAAVAEVEVVEPESEDEIVEPRVVADAEAADPAQVAPAAPEPVELSEPAMIPVARLANRSASPGPVDAATLVPLEEIAPAIAAASLSRRAFLGFGLVVAGGLAGASGLARLFPVFEDSSDAASPIVGRYDPAGKRWTFVVDTETCIGCGLCVVACKEENNVTEEAAYTRTWVERHVVTADGSIYVDAPEAGMHGFPPQSTAPGAAGQAVTASYFEPRLCMQCANSPCTSVCPVGATYRTEDGVILVDARRCIGCGYCVVACPYGARYLTPAGGDNPNDTPGIADKCTWCYHRITRGGKPACVEVCPVGARQFGDAADPASEIATLVRERNPQMLNPEYGTEPRVLYLGPSIEEA